VKATRTEGVAFKVRQSSFSGKGTPPPQALEQLDSMVVPRSLCNLVVVLDTVFFQDFNPPARLSANSLTVIDD
jgi:hypothetical protein